MLVNILKVHPVARTYKTLCNFVFAWIALLKYHCVKFVVTFFLTQKLKQFLEIFSVTKYSSRFSNFNFLRRLFFTPDESFLSIFICFNFSTSSKIAVAISPIVLFKFFSRLYIFILVHGIKTTHWCTKTVNRLNTFKLLKHAR